MSIRIPQRHHYVNPLGSGSSHVWHLNPSLEKDAERPPSRPHLIINQTHASKPAADKPECNDDTRARRGAGKLSYPTILARLIAIRG